MNTTDDGTPVAATVQLQVPEAYTWQAGPRGTVTITDLPCNREGTISVSYGKQSFSRQIDTIAGGSLTWTVDFAQHAEVSLDVPEKLGLDAEGQAMIKVSNLGGEFRDTLIVPQCRANVGTVEMTSTIEPSATLNPPAWITPEITHGPHYRRALQPPGPPCQRHSQSV